MFGEVTMKKFLWVIPIVLILGVGLYFLLTSGLFQKSEEETLDRFTESYQNEDYEDMIKNPKQVFFDISDDYKDEFDIWFGDDSNPRKDKLMS